MLLHVHKDSVDSLDLKEIDNEFAEESEHRLKIFVIPLVEVKKNELQAMYDLYVKLVLTICAISRLRSAYRRSSIRATISQPNSIELRK